MKFIVHFFKLGMWNDSWKIFTSQNLHGLIHEKFTRSQNLHGVKIYTGSIPRRQNLHGHKDTERNKIHGIEIHGAESAHRVIAYWISWKVFAPGKRFRTSSQDPWEGRLHRLPIDPREMCLTSFPVLLLLWLASIDSKAGVQNSYLMVGQKKKFPHPRAKMYAERARSSLTPQALW